MTVEVKKALAIQCFDVLVNGNLYERFDRKYQADNCAAEIKVKMGIS